MNRIVARFQDGRLIKGFTTDFLPTKDRFHVFPEEAAPGAKPTEVIVAQLKALFFVKSFAGNPHHEEPSDFPGDKPPAGRRIRVIFKDGEIMSGTTQGFDRTRPGFFVTPVARGSNNERCFVVTAATERVAFVE
jgi:hypothetical protein